MNSPKEVANNYIAIGKGKVNTPVAKMLVLGILAGAFIAMAGIGCTTVAVSVPLASVGKFVGACVFPGGLAMVLLAGSELFTGNCLLVIPLLKKEISLSGMLKNWVVVYLGNLIGGIAVAAVCVFSHQVSLFGNQLAVSVISTAAGKTALSFGDAFLKGVACNFLVCIAVWISFAAKQVSSKIAGLFFPIMMFVLCGFEHSIANMYYIAAGLFAKGNETYMAAAAAAGVDVQPDLGSHVYEKPASCDAGQYRGRRSVRGNGILVCLFKGRLGPSGFKRRIKVKGKDKYEQIILVRSVRI